LNSEATKVTYNAVSREIGLASRDAASIPNILLRCPSDSGYVRVANYKSLGLVPKPVLNFRRAHPASWRVWTNNLDVNLVLAKHILVRGQKWDWTSCEQTVARAQQLAEL
jgi:hypothetical protein